MRIMYNCRSAQKAGAKYARIAQKRSAKQMKENANAGGVRKNYEIKGRFRKEEKKVTKEK